jgi:hypothetical protein
MPMNFRDSMVLGVQGLMSSGQICHQGSRSVISVTLLSAAYDPPESKALSEGPESSRMRSSKVMSRPPDL